MTIETLISFFGWCTVINVAILLLVLFLTGIVNKDGFPFDFIAKIFGISIDAVRETHFRVFQQFRFAILAFNLVPYIALIAIANTG